MKKKKQRRICVSCAHVTPLGYVFRSANEKKCGMKLPPEEGTLGFLDMLIHDCRQYLMIAAGELRGIDDEGELALDDPTEDIEKITLRLKRLKTQCIRMTGRQPLDWQRGTG